jgi:hypothetical protein
MVWTISGNPGIPVTIGLPETVVISPLFMTDKAGYELKKGRELFPGTISS